MRQRIIGLAGVARSGKDSFYQCASKYLSQTHGLICCRYALADALKIECADFVQDKLGIDIYTTNTEEKEIIRPFLVWYGNVKRVQSKGRHWTDILTKQIARDKVSDVIFITDVRYAVLEYSELRWIRETLKGDLIHIRRYSKTEMEDGKVLYNYICPPNEHEEYNDPILRENADYKFDWETTPDKVYMEKLVEQFIERNIKI